MAEVAVDERRLLKTIRWWDGFVIGLANPGFLLVGLAFSILALGGWPAAVIWGVSAVIGALQAYVYAEPAAMFPDKPGGLSVYAREGWRKYFSLAGPIAVFGYWFAWSSVLAIYGQFVGLLLLTEFGGEGYFATESWDAPILTTPITWVSLIAVMCIVLCYVFNVRGMRPAVWFSYVVGALMILPVGAIAIGAFITGDFSNHQVDSNLLGVTPTVYGDPANGFHQFALIMVWLYIIGWSTYGPEAGATFAPEYKDTANDTRKALASVGILNVVLAVMLPIAVLGTIGYDGILADAYGVPYLVDVLHQIAGEGFGTFLVVCLCGGLLLSMNTATMDGSRALYALAEEKMTIKQLNHLNRYHVPSRAMTIDMLLNIFLVLYFGNIFFILAAGNFGYMFSHVLALSGVLLLRKDRPNWPRPIRLAAPWMVGAFVFCIANLLFIIFGLTYMDYTGYLWNSDFTDAWAKLPEMIGVAAGSLGVGVLGYIIAQRQHGRPFRWREPSDELPSQEAIDTAAAVAAAKGR
jgi:amino acid transporter